MRLSLSVFSVTMSTDSSSEGVEERPTPLGPIRAEDVLQDVQPRRSFVVPASANRYDLDFTSFRVWDEANPSHVLFEFNRPNGFILPPPHERPNNARVIKYLFDESFFKTPRLACRFVVTEYERLFEVFFFTFFVLCIAMCISLFISQKNYF